MTVFPLFLLASFILTLSPSYCDILTSSQISSSCTGLVSISQTTQLHKIGKTSLNIPVERGIKVVVKQTGNCCHHVFTRGRCRGERRVVENNEETIIKDHEHNGELSIVRFEQGKEGCKRSSRFTRRLCKKIGRYESEEAALKLEIEGGGDVSIGGSIYNITEVGIETIINVEGNNETSQEYRNKDVVVVKVNITGEGNNENNETSKAYRKNYEGIIKVNITDVDIDVINGKVAERIFTNSTQNTLEIMRKKEITTDRVVIDDSPANVFKINSKQHDQIDIKDTTTKESLLTDITPTDTAKSEMNITTNHFNEISNKYDLREESKVIIESSTQTPSVNSTPKGDEINVSTGTSNETLYLLTTITSNSTDSKETTTHLSKITTQISDNQVEVSEKQIRHTGINNEIQQDNIVRYRNTFSNATFRKYSRVDTRSTTFGSEESEIDTAFKASKSANIYQRQTQDKNVYSKSNYLSKSKNILIILFFLRLTIFY